MKYLLLIVLIFSVVINIHAQPIVRCINAFNIHQYRNNTTHQIRNYTQIWSGTNVYTMTEQIDWISIPGYPLSLATAYLTNYYLWSHSTTSGGPLILDHNVQWTATPGLYGGQTHIYSDQPLPPGISPVYPLLRTGSCTTNSPFQSYDYANSEWILYHNTNGPPIPSPTANWYFRFRVPYDVNTAQYYSGFVLYPGQLVYVSNPSPDYYIDGWGRRLTEAPTSGNYDPNRSGVIGDGPFTYGPVEDQHDSHGFNYAPLVDSYVPISIPPMHYIMETYIPSYFDR